MTTDPAHAPVQDPADHPELTPGASTPAPPEAAECQDWDPLAAQRTEDDPPLDVLLSGTVFFDIVFTGMDRLPRPGEELWSKGMGSSPGGIANLATAAAQKMVRPFYGRTRRAPGPAHRTGGRIRR